MGGWTTPRSSQACVLSSPGPPRVGAAEGPRCSGDPATLTSAGGRGETAAGASQEPAAPWTRCLPQSAPFLLLQILSCPQSIPYTPLCAGVSANPSTPLPCPPLPTFFDLFVYFFPWQPPVSLCQTAQTPYNLKLICLTAASDRKVGNLFNSFYSLCKKEAMKFPIETPRKQVNWDPQGW